MYNIVKYFHVCCSLEVCSDPCTTRCGHPFCQQCIATVMAKRGAQCPMCNANLNRRTVHRDNLFSNMITCFHKIEEAIKADIHVDSKFFLMKYFNNNINNYNNDDNNNNKVFEIC